MRWPFSNPFARTAPTGDVLTIRGWIAGKITRLNQGRMPTNGGATYNEDLATQGELLRQRTKEEVQNNGILEGVIFTHVNDIVGPKGPTLSVESDDEEFNTAFEEIWRKVWEMPDLAGQDSGTEMLQAAIRGLWHDGCWLAQVTREDDEILARRRTEDPDDVLGKIAARLYDIAPRRLSNPMHALANDKFSAGIERDERGRVLNYWIKDEFANDPTVFLSETWTPVPARSMVHIFAKKQAGQTNGAPLDASGLEAVNQCRDYDEAVIDAARSQAYQCIVLTSQGSNIDPIPVTGTVAIKKNSIMAAPPGYGAQGFSPTQPAQQYIPFRHERLREIGRPVGMPLMMILLDSSGHNYSSARFDNQIYLRGIDVFREMLRRKLLEPFAREVLKYARAGNLVKVPKKFAFHWHWEATPHVDPSKEFKGDEGELKLGLASLTEKLAKSGKAFDVVFAKIAKEIPVCEALGIIHPALLESAKLQQKAEAAAAGQATDDEDGKSAGDEQDEDERRDEIRALVREEIEQLESRNFFASAN